ncbi:uncharacterized mitochondrial protein AtMg00810-like [Malus domestica]|uniref:uncharacterized mitochondrial protein AtMg00810-like n=1 Tax=Malus domestica TaxID=3750 RepID=UPI003976E207
MSEEIAMIEKNSTWKLVNRPSDKPVIGVKWIYKTKLNLDGSIQKNKARLVAKGYSQQPGVDFNETFAPVASCEEMIEEFRRDMMRQYEMSDLGLLHHFLGIGVIQEVTGIFIHQQKYAQSLLERFNMKGCKSVATPLITNEKLCKVDGSESADECLYRRMVGSLLYLTATRPDIMYAASLLSRFMHNSTKIHLGTAKKVLRYISGTLDYGIKYEKGEKAILVGFCDSDWGGSEDDMRSTSGYAFTFGSGIFSWASVKQQSVALSTAEAEYVSAAMATSQAIWLRIVLKDFGEMQVDTTPLMCEQWL